MAEVSFPEHEALGVPNSDSVVAGQPGGTADCQTGPTGAPAKCDRHCERHCDRSDAPLRRAVLVRFGTFSGFRNRKSTAAQSRTHLGAIALAIVILLGSIARSGIAALIFDDADSLTFPILLRAITDGERLHWVSSAYLGVVPELPLFVLASVITPSVRWAILVNALLNILALHLGFAWLCTQVRGRRLARPLAGFATTTLVVLIVVEVVAKPVAVTSLLLLSTYYSGVPIMGVLVFGLVLKVLQGTDARTSAFSVFAAMSALVVATAASSFSNPLFEIMIVAPVALSLCALAAVRRLLTWRALELATVLVGSALAGHAMRSLIPGVIAKEAGGYVNLDLVTIMFSFSMYGRAAVALLATNVGWIEPVVVGCALLVCVREVRRSQLPARRWSVEGADRLLVGLVALSSVFVGPVVLAVLGAHELRYLSGVVVIPLVSGVVLFRAEDLDLLRRCGSHLRVGRVLRGRPVVHRQFVRRGVLVVLALLAALSVGDASRVLAVGKRPDTSCLVNALGEPGYSGVSEFWTARPLDVELAPRVRVLQVTRSLAALPWLNNLGSYTSRQFSFVLVDPAEVPVHAEAIRRIDVEALGQPSRVTSCRNFDVYFYAPGSSGNVMLNDRIRASVERELAIRAG